MTTSKNFKYVQELLKRIKGKPNHILLGKLKNINGQKFKD